MRTRAIDPAPVSDASTYTAAIDSRTLLATEWTVSLAEVLRNSRMMVTGSGRVATYGAGSLSSMTSDVAFALTRRPMSVIRAWGLSYAAPDALSRAAATATVKTRGRA